MELGLTIPLQKHLKIRSILYGEESDRMFCWDLHLISLYGTASLLVVHCYSRYVFTLFDLSRWEWDDLPGTFLTGLRQSFQNTGISDVITDRYLRHTGALRITKTHGRREVAYLNRAWEDVLSVDYTLDQTAKIQPMLNHAVNTKFCRCAGTEGLEKPEERLLRSLRDREGGYSHDT